MWGKTNFLISFGFLRIGAWVFIIIIIIKKQFTVIIAYTVVLRV